MSDAVWALGLMSGTSLDGIDAALVRTDGNGISDLGAWQTLPYEDKLRTSIREAVYMRGDIAKIEQEMTLMHADAVKALLKKAGLKPRDVRVIGFHGQTIAHRPHEGITWQMGNGALLAEKTGIDVVMRLSDRRDVAGGRAKGAPLGAAYSTQRWSSIWTCRWWYSIWAASPTSPGSVAPRSRATTSWRSTSWPATPGPATSCSMNGRCSQTGGEALDRDGKLALAGAGRPGSVINSYLSDPLLFPAPAKVAGS